MTRKELKSIIRECMNEMNINKDVEEPVNEDSEIYMVEDAEFDYSVIEALQITYQYENVEINEGASLNNIKEFHKVLSRNKKAVREAKKCIKNGDNEEAKKLIKQAISDLKEIRKQIIETDNNLPREVIQSLLFLFVPYISAGFTLYFVAMGTKAAGEERVVNNISALLQRGVYIAGTKKGEGDLSAFRFWRNPVFKKMCTFLGWTAIVTGIIDIIKQIHHYVTNIGRAELKGLGSLSIDMVKTIDNYISMLEKLEAKIA